MATFEGAPQPPGNLIFLLLCSGLGEGREGGKEGGREGRRGRGRGRKEGGE